MPQESEQQWRGAPEPGCVLCHQGQRWSSLLPEVQPRLLGCPLSRERKGRDVIFANEHQVTSPAGAIEVAESMSALGTGVTGGEPLLEVERVVDYCRALKEHFGPGHQIHLYTGLAPDEAVLRRLRGLVDEIRLHPPREVWPCILETDYARSAVIARIWGSLSIEVPSLPDR